MRRLDIVALVFGRAAQRGRSRVPVVVDHRLHELGSAQVVAPLGPGRGRRRRPRPLPQPRMTRPLLLTHHPKGRPSHEQPVPAPDRRPGGSSGPAATSHRRGLRRRGQVPEHGRQPGPGPHGGHHVVHRGPGRALHRRVVRHARGAADADAGPPYVHVPNRIGPTPDRPTRSGAPAERRGIRPGRRATPPPAPVPARHRSRPPARARRRRPAAPAAAPAWPIRNRWPRRDPGTAGRARPAAGSRHRPNRSRPPEPSGETPPSTAGRARHRSERRARSRPSGIEPIRSRAK